MYIITASMNKNPVALERHRARGHHDRTEEKRRDTLSCIHERKKSDLLRRSTKTLPVTSLKRTPIPILISMSMSMSISMLSTSSNKRILLITPNPLPLIRNREIRSIKILTNLIPNLTRPRQREKVTKKVINKRRNNNTREIIHIIHILRTNGDFGTDCTGKSDDVDQDSTEIGCVGAPGEAQCVVIWVVFARAVEGFY